MELAAYFDLLNHSEREALSIAACFGPDALQQPAGERWSPLQVLEHCCLTEALVMALLGRPAGEQHTAETVHGNEKLQHLLVNKRAVKIKAPDRLLPSGAFADRAAFEERFLGQRQALRDALEGGTLEAGKRLYPHPVLGNMTATDWLYFLVHHTQRHLDELKERIPATV